MTPDAFTLAVPQAALEDLRQRLTRARWPHQTPGEDPWAFGAGVAAVRELVDHWREGFDWRAQEAELNSFPQFRVELHGVPLHFLHVPGRGPRPMPLLLSHGWPGSVVEFLDLIPRLTDPERFGGDPVDSFTVVAPSLPGYGLSFRPGQPRLGIPQIADCLADLMTDVLGYPRFGAQGGDWGAHVAANLAARRPDLLTGIHLNFLPLSDEPARADASADEQRYAAEQQHWRTEEAGYSAIQGTKPQTLAFALTDSPVGLAAWIIEKFHAWTDHDGDLTTAVDRDRLLANISLYWFTGAIGSSFWPYYARRHGAPTLEPGRTVGVPVGYAAFPREVRRPPRSVAEHTFTDIRRWTEMPRGGHFAALEQPAALAGDIVAFYRALR